MAEASTFRGVIDFFNQIGIYDVVLPFLLVFAIVFAIFEKSKVFGVEKVGDETYPRKNINAIVAFVVAFLVIASARLVAIINEALANVVLLLIMSVFFLLLIGTFHKEGEIALENPTWRNMFMIIMFVGIVLIFLYAIKIDSTDTQCSDFPAEKCPWLVWAWGFFMDKWDSAAVGSILLAIVFIGTMVYITYGTGPKPKSENNKKSS